MSTRVRLALVLAALGLYVLGGIALLGLGVWSGLSSAQRDTVGDAVRTQVPFLVVGGLLHAAVLGVVVSLYFGRYVTGARRVATEVRIVTVANPAYRSEPSGPAEIRALAAAVNALADRRTAAEERADTGGVGSPAEHERARLAALVSQLRVGVVVCDEHGLVLLYNDAAITATGDGHALGLGRSVFGVVDRALVSAALVSGDAAADGVHVATARADDGSVDGIVVTFDSASMSPSATPAGSRLTYDFDLARRPMPPVAGDAPLSALTYTVLDTETTGLAPATDEIVALAAVRIVNGRVVDRETFERLVDPRRAMPPTAEAIHGISDAMVAGQPTVDQVLPSFAAFAAGTVLVAHDAAFDLAFLRHAAARHSVRLDVLGAPVLDTLLLSAALHPDASGHTLDAVAARLGVEVLGRHTALGDALATAEVFVRMLRLLDAQGVTTLADARRLSESTAHARVQRYPEATVTPDTRTLPSM